MGTTDSGILYRRLQKHLDRNFVGYPATTSGVDIRILQRLFTPEEAKIALALSMLPEPASTIHKRLGSRLSLAVLVETLDGMDAKGIILAIVFPGGRRYAKLPFAVGFYERQTETITAELERDTRQFFKEGFGEAFHRKKTTQMRVVPVNKKIKVERNVATYDEIRSYIQTSPGPFAVIPCICRRGKDLMGESCRQTELRENCLLIGAVARRAALSGTGKERSRDEMLSLLDQADTEGLVLQPENTQAPMFICCCCGCCCNMLTSAKHFPAPAEYFSSTYYAGVDTDTCECCGACLTRCPMEAIANPEGAAVVDRSRCIGCGLCISICPSGALSFELKENAKTPPGDTRALRVKMFQERYGRWGIVKSSVRKMFGLKI